MAARDIIVMAGSAGALREIRLVLGALPWDFKGSVFVVLHTSSEGPGFLADILKRAGTLPAGPAQNGEPIRPGHVYVAPPNHHLMLTPGRVELGLGPRENGFRPAADALFRTASHAYGPRVAGVVFSGGLDDGSLGMLSIKERGGVAIVQNPEEALYPSMPLSVMRAVEVDYVLRVAEMARVLRELASGTIKKGGVGMKKAKGKQKDPAALSDLAMEKNIFSQPPTPFICPQCGGALWQLDSGKLVHYQCHVGHGYTADTLLDSQDRSLEDAMWVAFRTLEDNAALRRRMARDARERGMANVGKGYDESAERVEERAGVIREVLLNDGLPKTMRGYGSAKPTKILSKAIRAVKVPTKKSRKT